MCDDFAGEADGVGESVLVNAGLVAGVVQVPDEFLGGDVAVGAGGEGAAAVPTNNREAASEVGIFPTLNGIISYRISKHFAVTARALWFSAAPDEFDGTMAEYHADIQYRWHKNAAVGLGYTKLVTELEVFDSDDPLLFNLDTSGPELFVRFSF